MSTIGKRVIFVGPADDSNHKPLNVEGQCNEAVLPGHIVFHTDLTGGFEGSQALPADFSEYLLVADKNQQQTLSVDDAWVVGENMVAIQPRSGEFINIRVAPGQNIQTRGTPLMRDASDPKRLVIATPVDGTTQIVGHSDEVINTTGATEDVLVCVRIP